MLQVTSVVEKKDAMTRRTYGYSYDEAGNIASESRQGVGFTPDSESSAFTFDSAGRLTRVAEGGAGTTSYTYDKAGNILTEITKAGTVTLSDIAYTYNTRNELTKKVANGIVTQYTYDNSGDLIRETTGTEVTAYEYDALGRMVRGTNAQGDISEYVYNGLGQRVAAVQTIQGANRANYGYRSTGNGPGSIHIGESLDAIAREGRDDTG